MIQDMTDVIIVASLIIAACSLAVTIAAGLGERKRPFSLLRLTGVPPRSCIVSSRWRVRCRSFSSRSVDRGRPRVGCLYLHSQVGIAFSIPGIAVLGNRSRRTRRFTCDHHRDVPDPRPDDGT